jgi:hypothetical protein
MATLQTLKEALLFLLGLLHIYNTTDYQFLWCGDKLEQILYIVN